MKVPKIFLPEKNTEKNLEKILSKKFYTLDKEGNNIKAYDFNGKLLKSATIGERMHNLETFMLYNKKMLTARFGESNRAVFDEKLNPIIMTPSHPNQTYSVFERKNNPSLLMINTTAKRTRGTRITYYQQDSTKLDDFYYELHDMLSNKAFVLKTKEQNYLALCFNNHTLLIHENLHEMKKLKTELNINDVSVVDMKGEERVIALCLKDDGPAFQVLRIFDNKLKLLEELNTETFKSASPEDPWHDRLLSFKPYKIGQKDYFFVAVERKKEKNRTDLKVLNTDFEEVFQLEDIVKDYVRVENFNGKDHAFVLANRRGATMIEVLDETFKLEDTITIPYSGLLRKYEVLNLNNVDYLAYIKEGYLKFYSGPFPLNYPFYEVKSITLLDTNNGLEKIIPFNYKGNDFLALEYGHGDGICVYDEDFKLFREFTGRDFCVA